MDAGDAEIGDLNNVFVFGQQKVLRFDIAVNYSVLMGVPQAGTDLFAIMQCPL
jgi:hypothetical protein